MDKTQTAGVEGKATKRITVRSILTVTGNAMADVLHVHTYLILTAGFQLQFHQRIIAVGSQHLITGKGILAVFLIIGRINVESCIFFEIRCHLSFRRFWFALDHGHIAPIEHHIVPRTLHFFLYALTLGKHHQSRSVTIETMQYKNAIGRIVLAHIIAKYMVGRIGFYTVGRNGQQTITFIDNYKEVVFINNTETRVAKLFITPRIINGYLIARMQRGIELCNGSIVYGYLSMGQIGLDRRLATVVKRFQ